MIFHGTFSDLSRSAHTAEFEMCCLKAKLCASSIPPQCYSQDMARTDMAGHWWVIRGPHCSIGGRSTNRICYSISPVTTLKPWRAINESHVLQPARVNMRAAIKHTCRSVMICCIYGIMFYSLYVHHAYRSCDT